MAKHLGTRLITGLRNLNNSRSFLSSSTAPKLSNSEVRRKRNSLYNEEKERQMGLITRVEKIKVEYTGLPEQCTLLMNKNLSTPYNCAMHIQELLTKRSAIALVNGQQWDMHRPLTEDCELQFLHFKSDDPYLPNQAFWRTCSFITGHILETAFREDFFIELCSFPAPSVKSGSFVYDAHLGMEEWTPSQEEIHCLSRAGMQLHYGEHMFERLEVDASVALKIFEENRFKSAQIPLIAAKSPSGSSVTLYRMADHIDITAGPLIANTNQIGRFNIVKIHDIESPDFGGLKRVQGLAIPRELMLHYWAYELLQERAKLLNDAPVPTLKKDS